MERAPVAAVSVSRKGCRAVLVTGPVTGQQATGRREDYKVLLGPVDTTPGAALPAHAQKQHASHMINRTGGEFVAGDMTNRHHGTGLGHGCTRHRQRQLLRYN